MDSIIKQHLRELAGIKANMKGKVLQLPQNPNINVINDNCFTVNFSQLKDGLNLSPTRYNFKYQCRAIARVIDSKPIEKLTEQLKTIIKDRGIKKYVNMTNKMVCSSFGYTLKIDDEVAYNLYLLIHSK